MSMALFKKAIDDIVKAFGYVETIWFTSQGEPLLHPNICEMVAYAHSNNAVKTSRIITNGLLLTNEMSEGLIESGLSYITFSIYGLSDEDYKKHCNTNVSFDKLVEQIRFFSKSRKETIIDVKVIDYIVKTHKEREKFHLLFEPVGDIVRIDNLYAEATPLIDFNSFAEEETQKYNKSIESLSEKSICHFPFYNMSVTLDGDVTVCCHKDRNIIGNIYNSRLKDIWDNQSFHFQRKMLEGVKKASKDCVDCTFFYTQRQKEDVLDHAAEICKKRYDDIILKRAGK
jgi:radical SAM protein with 4Fe4S-binding SPASM domain